MTVHPAPTAADVDEPQTPMWLPALGVAIFLGAGLAWAILPAESAPKQATASPTGAPAAAASAAAVNGERR